jgi:hypothetical protein
MKTCAHPAPRADRIPRGFTHKVIDIVLAQVPGTFKSFGIFGRFVTMTNRGGET